MSVNFILINGVAEKAKENYKHMLKEKYDKNSVADHMEKGDYRKASENLFNSDSFKEIFEGFQKSPQFNY